MYRTKYGYSFPIRIYPYTCTYRPEHMILQTLLIAYPVFTVVCLFIQYTSFDALSIMKFRLVLPLDVGLSIEFGLVRQNPFCPTRFYQDSSPICWALRVRVEAGCHMSVGLNEIRSGPAAIGKLSSSSLTANRLKNDRGYKSVVC